MAATRATRGREKPSGATNRVRDSATRGREKPNGATKRVRDNAEQAKDTAQEASDTVTGSLSDAAKSILGPAVSQLGAQAAERAAQYASEHGPKILQEQVLPKVMESAGVENPGDLAKAGISKAGEAISGAGGITGMAGKVLKKLGGGKGGGKGVATGHGQGRRVMIQQVQYVPVNVKDVYRAWTEAEWPEFMHRVSTLDRQIEEDSARYAIGVKGLFFRKSFTAEVREQVPFKFVVWNTTQGNIKNTGRISFHGEGDDLTLMVLNLDLAPSGLREKWVRGFRYHKRGIRGDFHRFAAWVQMRTQDELDEMEGWLGTVKGGQVIETHEEYVDEHEEEQNRGGEKPEGERDEGEPDDEAEDEAAEDEADDEGEEDDEEDEEPDDESNGYEKLSVPDLREELRERGLRTRGRRDVLIERLREG